MERWIKKEDIPYREYRMLELYQKYGQNNRWIIYEIGQVFNLTYMRVRQLIKRAEARIGV